MSDIDIDDADEIDTTILTVFRGTRGETRGPHARLGWGRFEGRLGRPVGVDVDGDDRFASDAITSGARDVVRGIGGPPCMHASTMVGSSLKARLKEDCVLASIGVSYSVRAPTYLRPSELRVYNSSIRS